MIRTCAFLAALLAGLQTIDLGAQVTGPDGTRRWRAKTLEGEDLVFEFRPTEVAPMLTAGISRSASAFVYSYSITNRAVARDAIVGCFIEVAQPVTRDRDPAVGWVQVGPQTAVPRIGWFVRKSDEGIRPGETVSGFGLRSRNWPGPTIAKCNGVTAMPEEPGWLSEEAKRELQQLRQKELVESRTIAPIIVVDRSRPLSYAYAAVVRSYRAALRETQAARRTEFVQALDQLRTASIEGQGSRILERLLAELLSKTKLETADRSFNQIMIGLGACLEELIDTERGTRQIH